MKLEPINDPNIETITLKQNIIIKKKYRGETRKQIIIKTRHKWDIKWKRFKNGVNWTRPTKIAKT